jgi:hypothetical protein
MNELHVFPEAASIVFLGPDPAAVPSENPSTR